ncbi:MAG TPA: phosphoglucosamine mutase [Thermotoga sp.]|nr:phosphoglucosamine mutase [Thermotoga sp.]
MELFGTDGIRGEVGTELTPELAFRIGNILGNILDIHEVLIAKDTRATSDTLEDALSSGFSSAGVDVLKCGVLPTPSLALLTKIMKTSGVVISASHNPPQYNGIKVFLRGYKMNDEKEKEVEKLYEKGFLRYVDFSRIGRIKSFDSAQNVYIGFVLHMFEDLNLKGFEITLDVANGSTLTTAPEVFERLGAKVKVYNNKPDGFNINVGCGSTNPEFLKSVKRMGEIGITFDGDGDRCIMIDESGEIIHGDKILGVLSKYLLDVGRMRKKVVVGTVLTNTGLEIFLKNHGIKLLRAKVGDKNVLEKMLKEGSILGGERSGHVIIFDRSTTGDGLITSLEVLSAVTYYKKKLLELSSMIEDYPQVNLNVHVKDKKIVNEEKVKDIIEGYEKKGFRIVVRPSGTEPVIRIMVEGKDSETVKNIAKEIAGVIEDLEGRSN